ncbi:MAG: type II secretion system protein GspG, partial [Verrucomicrobiota bacterium]
PVPAPPPRERIEVRRPSPIALNFDSNAFQRKPDGKIFKKYEIQTTSRLHQPGEDPVEDLQIISNVLDSYRTIFQENPIAGTNVEVMTALTGDNEYDLVFIDPDHPAINEDGELTDRWGTPFFFHAVSSKQPIDVYSAGPDKERGTGDDIAISERGTASLRDRDQSDE